MRAGAKSSTSRWVGTGVAFTLASAATPAFASGWDDLGWLLFAAVVWPLLVILMPVIARKGRRLLWFLLALVVYPFSALGLMLGLDELRLFRPESIQAGFWLTMLLWSGLFVMLIVKLVSAPRAVAQSAQAAGAGEAAHMPNPFLDDAAAPATAQSDFDAQPVAIAAAVLLLLPAALSLRFLWVLRYDTGGTRDWLWISAAFFIARAAAAVGLCRRAAWAWWVALGLSAWTIVVMLAQLLGVGYARSTGMLQTGAWLAALVVIVLLVLPVTRRHFGIGRQ